MIPVSLKFNITAPITLPKGTVYVPPVGSPTVTYHPVQMSISGLLPGDSVVPHFLKSDGSAATGFVIVSINTNSITIENRTTLSDIVIASGYVDVTRQVEPFKVYATTTDVDGIATIVHGLYYQPTKYLATALVGPAQENIILCFISADTSNASFQVFANGVPYVNSAISFSAQLS